MAKFLSGIKKSANVSTWRNLSANALAEFIKRPQAVGFKSALY
jgi:hypothetical protein